MNMKNILVIGAHAILAAAAPLHKRIDPNPNLAVDLPLYSWPKDGNWDGVFSTVSSSPKVTYNIIVNPQNGPSTWPLDDEYVQGVAKLNSYPNTNVYGYIHTCMNGHCERPVSEIIDDIYTYTNWTSYTGADIHLDGIFVDEAPQDTKYRKDLTQVTSTIRDKFPSSIKIWTNPGCIVDAEYYEGVDRVTAFEDTYEKWMDPARTTIPWDLHDKTSVMILNYDGQSDGPASQAKILIDRGFQSGLLYGMEDYQQLSSTWQSFAKSLGGDEANGTY